MGQFCQAQYETQITEHANIYRFRILEATLAHYTNSKRLLFQGGKQMMLHLPNRFCEIYNIPNPDLQQTTPNLSTQPRKKRGNNSNCIQNTELTNNSYGENNLNLSKAQISEVISNWYSIHVQTFGKATQTEEELIQNQSQRMQQFYFFPFSLSLLSLLSSFFSEALHYQYTATNNN